MYQYYIFVVFKKNALLFSFFCLMWFELKQQCSEL